MSSSRYKTSKEKRKAEKKAAEAEKSVKELTPVEQRRERIIQFGVGILVVAFMMTSGIVCVNLNPETETTQQQQERTIDDVQQGINTWKEELGKNPDDAAALANLGFYYNRRALQLKEDAQKDERAKILDLARTNLEKAIEKDPDYVFSYQELSQTFIILEKNEEARKILNKGLEKAKLEGVPEEDLPQAEGNRVQLLMGLAAVEIEEKNYDEALKHLDDGIKIKPGEAKLYLHRAMAFHKLERMEEAEKALDMAADIGQNMRDQETLYMVEIIRRQLFPDATPTPGAPTGDATPTGEATPENEATPVSEATPTEEASPVSEATPATEATPVAETTPEVEATPTPVATP